MIIYRVENKDGAGPYSDIKFVYRWEMMAEHTDENGYPCGRTDDLIMGSEYHFGFKDEGQARWWFRNWWRQLEEYGFKLVQYEVDEKFVKVGNSKKQVAFNIFEASLLTTSI